jgi:serine/threonine protein kinase
MPPPGANDGPSTSRRDRPYHGGANRGGRGIARSLSMKAELEVTDGYPHRKVTIDDGRPITIGRSKAADIQILHSVVSRLHCQLHYDGTSWVVKDLDSRNGTWFGEERIKTHSLGHGDHFLLGRRIEFSLKIPAQTRELAGAEAIEGTCAFCLTSFSEGAPATRDAEGHLYHKGCLSLSRLVGAEMGGVRVIERLSGTGPAHRLRAHQPSLNRHVLLYAFDERVVATGNFKQKLLDEVRGISRLLHPNILQIHDMIEHRGMMLVVMEYFDGSSLKDILAKRRFVNVPGALSIASQISDGLAHAQDQELILNRISPADIYVNDDHQAKLEFFRPPLSISVPVADLPYVAPEVISSGGLRSGSVRPDAGQRDHALRSAVYSLGAILYHMLAGIPPHEGETEEQLLPKILKDSPPSLRRVNLKVSPALARVVERTLDKDPANRPADFKTLKADLKKIIAPAL